MPNCQNNMCSRTSGHPTSRQAAPSRSMGMYNSRNVSGRQTDFRSSAMPAGRQCSEDCSRSNDFLKGTALAMAYVPWQQWQNIYEICRGFEQGTIFEDLDKPFTGKGGRRQ
nr:spore coat associated protein CotJA [Mediterraneibacter glycyrrhizinilyticus]